MVSKIFVARANKNRRANTVATFLGHCLLAIVFIAGGGCSAGGGGESSPPVVQNQSAPTVANIVLTPQGVSLQVGQTQQLTATAKDEGGNTIPGVPFTWSSIEPSVASINSNGVVVGLSGGGTAIRASVADVTSAPATVAVMVAPPIVDSITLTPQGASLQVGQTQQLTATAKDGGGNTIPGVSFTWSSSEPSVASINSNGVVAGLSGGGTSIRVSGGGITSAPATVTVTVVQPIVASITLAPQGASLQVGQTQQLTATARDTIGNVVPNVTFTWTSSNQAVASINSNGLATGLDAGSTIVGATVGSISTGMTLAVTAGSGGGGGGSNSYSTSFDQNENPISEGGQWLNGLTTGLDWLDIRTEGGIAYGTRTNQPGFAIDPTAILTGAWGWNQTAEAVLFVGSVGANKEVELRLNSSLKPHVCDGYEILYEVTGTIAIVRWNGLPGESNYTFLRPVTNIGRALVTGDRIKATNVNGTITAYLNNSVIMTATDTTYQAGAPGFGLNTYGGADPTTYGLSSFMASSN